MGSGAPFLGLSTRVVFGCLATQYLLHSQVRQQLSGSLTMPARSHPQRQLRVLCPRTPGPRERQHTDVCHWQGQMFPGCQWRGPGSPQAGLSWSGFSLSWGVLSGGLLKKEVEDRLRCCFDWTGEGAVVLLEASPDLCALHL